MAEWELSEEQRNGLRLALRKHGLRIGPCSEKDFFDGVAAAVGEGIWYSNYRRRVPKHAETRRQLRQLAGDLAKGLRYLENIDVRDALIGSMTADSASLHCGWRAAYGPEQAEHDINCTRRAIRTLIDETDRAAAGHKSHRGTGPQSDRKELVLERLRVLTESTLRRGPERSFKATSQKEGPFHDIVEAALANSPLPVPSPRVIEKVIKYARQRDSAKAAQ